MALPVLIVGAGPVGLSAALMLVKAGIDIRIVDSGSDIDQRMRASTFHPPTLDMLDSLGMTSDLVALGLTVPRWRMRQHESGEFVEFDLAQIADATNHPYRLQVEQHRYCELAAEELARLGIDVEFDTRVTGASQSDEQVTVEIEDKADATCDWVIGADGASSAMRKSCGLEYGGKTYTHSSVLVSTEFPFNEALSDIADVSYCWSGRGPFTLLRLKGLWRASLYPGIEDIEEAASEERIRDWLEFIHPDARDSDLFDIHPYRVHERCIDRFRVGRILLAGDAAHLNPPSGGMGMNGGIHDAVNLCDKLIAVFSGEDSSRLDQYDRQRRHVAANRVIPQASANRARMATTDLDEQAQRLATYRSIAADEAECREFLLKGSMITSLQEANAID